MGKLLIYVVVALVATGSSASSACHFPYNAMTATLDSVCFTTLANGSDFSIRKYSSAGDGGASIVGYNVSVDVTTYQEAFNLGTFAVLDYFMGSNTKNISLAASRTTPLILRPSHPKSKTPWFVQMAIAPGTVAHPPGPLYGVTISPLVPSNDTPLRVAARHERLNSSPQPSDFDACVALLVESLRQSTSWRFDASSPASPSHAYFTGRDDYTGPFDIECWVGVQST